MSIEMTPGRAWPVLAIVAVTHALPIQVLPAAKSQRSMYFMPLYLRPPFVFP